MASRRTRKGQENAAPKAFEANLPKETRIETPGGLRSSARIRNKKDAAEASSPPLIQQEPVATAQGQKPRAKSKLSQAVSQNAKPEDDQQEPAEKVASTAQSSAQPAIAESLLKKPKKPRKLASVHPKGVDPRTATATWAQTQHPVALPAHGEAGVSQFDPVRSIELSGAENMATRSESEYDGEPTSESDVTDTLSEHSEDLSGEGEDSDESEPVHKKRRRKGSRGTRRVRIASPEVQASPQRQSQTKHKDKNDPPVITSLNDDVQQIPRETKTTSVSPNGDNQKRRQSPKPPSTFGERHPPIGSPPKDADFSYLANKSAFWWAHVYWIIACFLIALLLWTLALSLYWGNHFAALGPPAPCDMTISTRPFPQTWAESFKIFRRPDVSWDPVVRQQMADFGKYVGADPWLMDNCILPRNVIKLPLVTCQKRLPWYNLTEAQVMWLNENNDWAFNLNHSLTEKFNRIFDMQFELQELQMSWMLSDHGPASPDYNSRRCQACKDLLVKKHPEEEVTKWWQSKTSKKSQDREKTSSNRLSSFEAFSQLKELLVAEENEPIPLVEVFESDEPYWKGMGSVGSDLVYTEPDGSTWQPARGGYTVLQNVEQPRNI